MIKTNALPLHQTAKWKETVNPGASASSRYHFNDWTGCCTAFIVRVNAVSEADSGNAAMYAGLAVAVLIFIIIIIFIVCLLRRRHPLFVGQPPPLTYLLIIIIIIRHIVDIRSWI